MIRVPDAFARWRVQVSGEAGRRWLAGLPGAVEELSARWDLTLDAGDPRHGGLSLVVLAHRGDEPCALKLTWPEDSTRHEALALRTWAGQGAVRLLAEDPAAGALLLERADGGRSLHTLPVEAAAEVAGGLLRRLAVPAPPGLPRLADIAAAIGAGLPQRAAGSPVPAAWVDAAVRLAPGLGGGDRLVHSDLHYGNVLAAVREPWLAVDARPVAGHPEFAVPELVWTRADDLPSAADVRAHLDRLVDAAGLDRELATAWTVVRCVDYWLWGLERGLTLDPARCERVLAAVGPEW